ncbi:MAG: response regulator transcription factor [Blastocatellia bacterium]
MIKRVNILIVDDSVNIRRMIRNVVSDLVAEVYECGDGSEALAAYRNHRPDWVLMDIRMKQMNGFEATRQIKAAYPAARIIMVTVCKGDDMKAAARLAGASNYVMKDNLQELYPILAKRTDDRPSQPIAK